MKIFLNLVVILISVAIVYGVLMFGLSELGREVVTLVRPEPDGSTKNIRVWIVDADNKSWIEHGDSESYWIKQLSNNSELLIIREGEEKKYIAFADRDSHDLYRNLRREKYGFSDKMLDILAFGATSKENCESIPVRLE